MYVQKKENAYRQSSFSKYIHYQKQAAGAPKPENKSDKSTTFFSDGKKKIDYVLVYAKDEIEKDARKSIMLYTYLNHLKSNGLQIEQESGLVLDALVCVKVHAPKAVLNKYVDSYRMELSMNNPNYKYHRKIRLKCLRSIITCPDSNNPITQRAPDTLSGKQPVDFTNAERIYLTKKILSLVKYDDDESNVGIDSLISEKIFLAAYPLHDSLTKWTDEGPLTDRQLLAKFWASTSCFLKEQPLTLIERYYGPSVAFYFAWAEYYTFMLVPAAFLGFICFVTGIIYFFLNGTYIVDEICNSDQILCPYPMSEYYHSKEINEYCAMSKMAYMIENPFTVIYSILMTLWGIVFMILWNRKQAQLSMRWNLNSVITENDLRLNFMKKADVQRVSSITGSMDYYFSFGHHVRCKLVSYISMILVLFLYFLGVVVVAYVRHIINYYGSISENWLFNHYNSWIEIFASCSLTVAIIIFFGLFKKTISHALTKFENPRTKEEFERKYTVKFAVMSIANLMFPACYLAFLKGHFYTHPGDSTEWTLAGIFKADMCKVSGCLLDLGIQLAIFLMMRNTARLFIEFMIPLFIVYCKQLKYWKKEIPMGMQWEEDFVLVESDYTQIYTEYVYLVLQYAFMTFFVVSLPIAPLLALINGIIEIRLDAIKILKQYRRIVMRKTAGIEEWNDALKFITFFGTISNPLLIAYNSNLVSRYIYLFNNDFSLKGFVNSTLSEFLVDDYPEKVDKKQLKYKVKNCYYVGRRHPPTHSNKYQLTGDYWFHFAVKSIFFILLENLCLMTSLLLKRLIPAIPRKVRLKREYDERILQEERLKAINV